MLRTLSGTAEILLTIEPLRNETKVTLEERASSGPGAFVPRAVPSAEPIDRYLQPKVLGWR